jgi:hypothetical protein
MNLPEQITFGLACLGSFLGVLSFLRDWQRDRALVKVKPIFWLAEGGRSGLGIEVVNVGALPVTITQVGFETHDDQVMVNLDMWFPQGERLPHRLEPRTALTVYWPAGADQDHSLTAARRTMAKTACGLTFTGTSAGFEMHLAKLRAAAQTNPPRQ